MRRLTDCGDGQHKPIRASDSYGNDIFKCKECGNRVYSKGGEVPTMSGSSTLMATSACTTFPGYQSGYSINKPKPINFMNSASSYYTSTNMGS